MEQLDRQIVQICDELGCSFFDHHLTSLEQLSHEDIVELFTRCLWVISPSSKAFIDSCKVSYWAYEGFKRATSLAYLSVKYNLQRKFGYQTLLYGSSAQVRQAFIAVYERIPKEISSHLRHWLLRRSEFFLESRSVWMLKFGLHVTWENVHYWRQFYDELGILSVVLSSTELMRYRAGRTDHRNSEKIFHFRSSESISSRVSRLKSASPVSERVLHVHRVHVPGGQISCEPTTIAQTFSNQVPTIEALNVIRSNQRLLDKVSDSVINSRSRTDSISRSLDLDECAVVGLLWNSMAELKFLASSPGCATRSNTLQSQVENTKQMILRCFDGVRALYDSEKLRIRERYVECCGDFQKLRCLVHRRTEMANCKGRRLHLINDFGDGIHLLVRLIKEAFGNMRKQYNQTEEAYGENMALRRQMKWTTPMVHRVLIPIDEILFEVDDRKGERAYNLFGSLHTNCMNSMIIIEQNGMTTRRNVELFDLIGFGKQHFFAQQLHRIRKDLQMVHDDSSSFTHLMSTRFPRPDQFVPPT